MTCQTTLAKYRQPAQPRKSRWSPSQLSEGSSTYAMISNGFSTVYGFNVVSGRLPWQRTVSALQMRSPNLPDDDTSRIDESCPQ